MKEKQIEEMAKDLRALDCLQHNPSYSIEYQRAMGLYSLGYRKASEVVSELIEEIDNALHDMAMEYANAGRNEYFAVCEMVHHKVIASIEKKYTESEDTE